MECGKILSDGSACPHCKTDWRQEDPLLRNSFAHQDLVDTDVFYERQEDGVLYTFTYPLYLKLAGRTLPQNELYRELLRTLYDLGYPLPLPNRPTGFAPFGDLSRRAVHHYLRRDFALFYRRICGALSRIYWSGDLKPTPSRYRRKPLGERPSPLSWRGLPVPDGRKRPR